MFAKTITLKAEQSHQWVNRLNHAFGVGLMLFLTPALWVSAAPDVQIMHGVMDQVRGDSTAHEFLEKLCDTYGGRMVGLPEGRAAIEHVAKELRALGLDPVLETFDMPGWQRGADVVELRAPINRTLRAAAISYTAPHALFEAEVVHLGRGSEAEFSVAASVGATGGQAILGKVGLLDANPASSLREIEQRAVKHGLRGLLFTNRVAGGQLLARTGNFKGETLPVPAYSITQEDGQWLQRLLARGLPLRVALETRSHPLPVTGTNIVLRLPGATAETVVVGAHIDSWDLGQGAIDNGIGVAQLYALAKVLRDKPLRRTVELVWLDAEEAGMWGSIERARRTSAAPIVAMVNLDMVGVPIAVNALGDADTVPVLEAWNAALGDKCLPAGAENICWLGSDHTPYQLSGVRAITFHAPIAAESVRYYHDYADTIDKVSPALIADSAAPIAGLVYWLAQEETLTSARRSVEDTKKLFASFGLESRLRSFDWWPETPPDEDPSTNPRLSPFVPCTP